LLSTRSVVLWGGMLIAVALLSASLAVVPKKAEAATKLVTKSFSNTNQILIPDASAANPYPSAISSSFPRGSKVRDVNVTLRNYTHDFPDDVDVLLVHAGVNRTIMSDVGHNFPVNNINLSLNDESANGHLADEGQLGGGIFQPTNITEVFVGTDFFALPAPNPASAKSSLSGFDGSRAKGTWKLFVQDDANGQIGSMAGGWTVKIKAAVPQ
jgi:subtilisin-like proprotein convertase family protein